MGATYLDDIVSHHRARVARDDREWTTRVESVRATGPSFAGALRSRSTVGVIAELKRRSPSRGWIAPNLDAATTARAYESGGAAALSVLTDEAHFAGSPEDLADARQAVRLPILRKDFTLSANDVLDTAQMGASAVLLIVAALDDAELALFVEVAQRVGLDALIEVHDGVEARRALGVGATLIGVNQRNLRSFEVDPHRAALVAAEMPTDVTTVAESGLVTRADVEGAAAAGFDAVLVGESLLRSGDPAARVRELSGVAKVARV